MEKSLFLDKTLRELGLLAKDGAYKLNPKISGISVDSRVCKPGDLFAAMPGTLRHGGEFIHYAIRMGAGAILTDAEGLKIVKQNVSMLEIPFVIVKNPRMELAKVSARFYAKQPAIMIAVTGTNGKTSVANFTRQIWEFLGKQAVNFGTSGVEGAYSAVLRHTTPEPITLHKLLAKLKDTNIRYGAMEASSHGLDQYRLDGVYLTAAGFTNFTQDHLDYHDTFEEYFKAKLGLFDRVLPPEGSAVINMDDPKGVIIAKICQSRGQDVITVGSKGCDLTLLDSRFDTTGQDLRFSWKEDVHTLRLSLIGGFQAQNVMLAAGLVIACGANSVDVFKCLTEIRTVPGRMELAATRKNGAPVFVDFAHTPDAIETTLKAMRSHIMGRLIIVLGAGGDRDKSKRILMGKAAKNYADLVFVTDDNPRNEDPAKIRSDVMQGCMDATEIDDRAQAILCAVDALQPGDALLIAGKGHETGQIIGDDILPFNDVEQASIAVAALDGLEI